MPVPPPPNRQAPPPPKSPGALDLDETLHIMRDTLNDRHRDDPNVLRFIQEYMKCRHAGQAAVAIGLTPQSGHALKNRRDIHNCIEKLTAQSVQKHGYDATEMIERAKEIANVDPVEMQREDGSYKTHMSEISPEVRRSIKRLKVKNLFGEDPNGMKTVIGEIVEYEFYDKLTVIKMLGQEKDVFKDKKEVKHEVGANMAAVLLESKRRATEAFGDLIDVSPVAQLEEGKG